MNTTDNRPTLCRERLRDEGAAYPRSSCASCGTSIATGLKCLHNTDVVTQGALYAEASEPVRAEVPLEALSRLYKLAREAGEDLEAYAMEVHKGEHPAIKRRRERVMREAENLIDAADALQNYCQGRLEGE